MDKFEALDRLQAMADGMAQQFPSELDPTVSPQGVWLRLEDAVWLEQAIRTALDVNSPSRLDEAMGLTGGVGRPRGPGNARICQTWVNMGAKLDMEVEDLEQIAMQACRSYPQTFTEIPTLRQVRSAIYADGRGFSRAAKDGPALTSEAVEALAVTIEEGVDKLVKRRLAEDLAARIRLMEQK